MRTRIIRPSVWRQAEYIFLFVCLKTNARFSLQQGSAPRPAMGETCVATAATAPCPGMFGTRLRPDPRGARSTVTPASRSPTFEVTAVRRKHPVVSSVTTESTPVCHVYVDMRWFFSPDIRTYKTDCTFEKKTGFFFLQVSWFKNICIVSQVVF